MKAMCSHKENPVHIKWHSWPKVWEELKLAETGPGGSLLYLTTEIQNHAFKNKRLKTISEQRS